QGCDGDEYSRAAFERAGDGVSPAPTRATNITPEPPTERRRAPTRLGRRSPKRTGAPLDQDDHHGARQGGGREVTAKLGGTATCSPQRCASPSGRFRLQRAALERRSTEDRW